jgi:RNA polymerase-binding transcription factor DksA
LRPAPPTDLETCRFKLIKVLERLAAGRREWEVLKLEQVSGTAATRTGDELALFCRRYLADHRSDWTSFLARQVTDALDRIDNGDYGRCVQCGQTIPANRLAALPWVALCIECQEENAERRA